MNRSFYFKFSVVIISFLIVWTLRDFILLIICSLVISNVVSNLCNQIQTILKLPRFISLLIVLLGISFIIFAISIIVLPPFIREFNEILIDIPNGLSRVNELINSNLNKFNDLLYGKESERIVNIFDLVNDVVPIPDGATIAKAIQESFINIINLAGNLGSGFIRVIFVLVVSFMISIEPKAYKEGVLFIVPKGYIIMPSILKKKSNLLPGLTLISQFGFTFIFGPLGLVLSLPIVVVTQVLIKELINDN